MKPPRKVPPPPISRKEKEARRNKTKVERVDVVDTNDAIGIGEQIAIGIDIEDDEML